MIDRESNGGGGRRLDWRQVRILYRRELRAALREKVIVINSILIPIFLYPLVMWLAFTGILFVNGQSKAFVSRVRVEWPSGQSALRSRFEREKSIQLIDERGTLQDAEALIKQGKLEAWLEFLPANAAASSLSNNFQARITCDESRERSATARKRIERVLAAYRADWLRREGIARGIPAAQWQEFVLQARNVASTKQMGAFLMGMILPLLFVIMVAAGCFYPAIDTIAGERERQTWETLMSTAAGRSSIVMAKYLYVATLGSVAGILNLAAMALTLKPILDPIASAGGVETVNFGVPWAALPVLGLAAVLLAGFISAGMMICASFARTFKEGQAMITPFYIVVMLPAVFLQNPGLRFTLPLAAIPIVNIVLMVRSALAGSYPWTQISLTVASSAALIGACLWLAGRILKFDDMISGSYEGRADRLIVKRLFRWKKKVADSQKPT